MSDVAAPARLPALDLLRGLVMVLMAVDHVDAATNPRHVSGDAAVFGSAFPLSAPDFLTRWCTHLCAPTFVLLAGVSVALSSARGRTTEGGTTFDRHLILRGGLLILLEILLVSKYWRGAEEGPISMSLVPIFLQVLYALGGGLILLAFVRRLSSKVLLALSAAILIGAEVVRLATLEAGMRSPFLIQLLFVPGVSSIGLGSEDAGFDVLVIYPLLPWLPVMLFGFVLGRQLVAGSMSIRRWIHGGVILFAVFLLLRGIDGFGNMALHRRSTDLLEWLHCSKYPPSITFLAMELCLAFWLLALASRFQSFFGAARWNPLLILGQVPLFFYLLHLPAIGALLALGLLPERGTGSAGQSWTGAALVVAVCLPVCAGYRSYKLAWRHTWTRFL